MAKRAMNNLTILSVFDGTRQRVAMRTHGNFQETSVGHFKLLAGAHETHDRSRMDTRRMIERLTSRRHAQ